MKNLLTAKDCLLFLSGNGYGNGYGNGDGNGNGYGYGDGYGYGNGDGNGNGKYALPHPYYKVDGIWCEFLQIRGRFAHVNIVDMYNVKNCKPAWIARDGDKYAHGETLHEAQESLMYKISDRDTGRYVDWKLDDVKTKSELIGAYRVITGACEFGTRQFCNGRDLPDKCTIREAIKLTAGQYGAERFAEFFDK